jgi:hypothetical protein
VSSRGLAVTGLFAQTSVRRRDPAAGLPTRRFLPEDPDAPGPHTADAAKDQSQKLTVDQTKYFAANLDRIQLVGQAITGAASPTTGVGGLFGIGILLVAGAVIIIALN